MSKITNTKKLSRKNQKIIPTRIIPSYRDLLTGKQQPVPKSFLDQLAKELISWAINDKDAIILSQFFYERGIPHATFHSWLRTDSDFKNIYETAKRIIGNRRESGAITRKYEAGMIKASMSMYSDDWKELEDYRSEQRQKRDEKTASANIQWVLEKFPDSKLVPEKKKEENEL